MGLNGEVGAICRRRNEKDFKQTKSDMEVLEKDWSRVAEVLTYID